MINIFQFLKQGTSLSRQSLHSNAILENQIIVTKKVANKSYHQIGRFNASDQEYEDPIKVTSNNKNTKNQIKNRLELQEKKNQLLRKQNHIKVNGLDYPPILNNFTKLIQKYKIKDQLIRSLQDFGYSTPTAVQMQAIPCLLEKRNTIVTAPTGTGKTLAFLLPMLQNLKHSIKIKAIIMVPQQQLTNQIIGQLNKFQTQLTYKECSQFSEEEKTKISNNKSPGYDIIVTTPLAFLHTFENKEKLLKCVEYIVLDQCDKCFEQSFFEQMKQFLGLFKNYNPVYALFSATIQNPVEQVLNQFLDDVIRIKVGGENKVLDKISQTVEFCTNELGKLIYLKDLLIQGKITPPTLIFVQQKQRAKQLYYELKKIMKQILNESRKVEVLSSQKSRKDRQQILQHFGQGKYWILISTDLVARGIDFKNVNLVINYDFPNSMLTYIHRVGRTGRAERKGQAITLFTEEDKPLVRSLGNLLKTSGCEIPEWICEMPKARKEIIKKLEKYPVKRLPVGKADGRDKQWQKQLGNMEKKWAKIKKHQQQKGENKVQDNEDSGWIQVENSN